MPLIETLDQELLDPLSDKVADKLRATGLSIDRFKLKEFVYNRAKNLVLETSPSLGADAIARLVDFHARLDYTHDLDGIVTDFLKLFNSLPNVLDEKDKEERIAALERHYQGIFGQELPEEHKDRSVDHPVQAGGLTRLHVAAQSGNLQEVKRLVEEEGAKVNIKDNSRLTPRGRAEAMGHVIVAQYLANFS